MEESWQLLSNARHGIVGFGFFSIQQPFLLLWALFLPHSRWSEDFRAKRSASKRRKSFVARRFIFFTNHYILLLPQGKWKAKLSIQYSSFGFKKYQSIHSGDCRFLKVYSYHEFLTITSYFIRAKKYCTILGYLCFISPQRYQ